jgi:predicted Zn-dependent protease
MPALFRPFVLSAALAFGAGAAAQEAPSGLPDIGSSAGEILSPAQEKMYGEMTLRELRRYGLLLEDPLVEAYFQNLGFRLVARSEKPRLPFTFFMVKSRDINAFATLGGYIGVNAGLVLTAEREDEVAAVVAHEISHVTQRHVLRGAERAQKDSIPIALAMIGALIAAQQSGVDDDAVQAAIVGGVGLMQQRQINYTRSNEHEADRIGVHTLARAGYDPVAMADFFARMERAMRGNQGGWQAPEYLRTHPVSTTRISEAKDRAAQIQRERGGGRSCVHAADGSVTSCRDSDADAIRVSDTGPINPLLPLSLAQGLDRDDHSADTGLFELARERLRVLSAESPAAAVAEYQRMRNADPAEFGDARRYGLAIAQMQLGQTADAEKALVDLRQQHPDMHWISLALAETAQRSGHRAVAEQRYAELLAVLPSNRAVILSYARSLSELGTPEAGRRAQDILRPLLAEGSYDANVQLGFARASELAGDTIRAGEAYAESAYLGGRPEDALNQLERLKKRDDLDYYQRARIDARIAAIMPTVLEWRDRGLRPQDQADQLQSGMQPAGGLSFEVSGPRAR